MYECHITIAPAFGARRDEAQAIAEKHTFRLADLLMQKSESDTPTPSARDTFMTGHGDTLHVLQTRMIGLINELVESEFIVYRAKIEHIIFDTKYGGKLAGVTGVPT